MSPKTPKVTPSESTAQAKAESVEAASENLQLKRFTQK
ncbi:Uncharacterised protein [Actinobacillus equuli]|nr:Uncharacterised protein [Actinobacillus equuli]